MIRNVLEEHTVSSYETLRHHFAEFCGCALCRSDVLVYALNRLPPRYVASLEGSAVTEVTLEKEQSRAAIDVTVMEGFRKVALSPRCGRGAVPRRL
jgi:competence protein ComFB